MSNYRLYSFTNMYISPIQRGIQTAHIVSELSQTIHNKDVYNQWASIDKTIVVLEGGNQKNLQNIYDSIACSSLSEVFPFASFHEDEDSLGGALTAVGIIIPDVVYEYTTMIRNGERSLDSVAEFDRSIYSYLAFSRLA